MTDDTKQFQDLDKDMTAQTRNNYAHDNPQHNGANKGDELGPNTEIGSKLRALYTSIQDESIPDRFLDLLEKLDQVENSSSTSSRN